VHILVDGYNISLKKGTGIATYAKKLVAAIKEKNHQCSVLYDFPTYPAKSKNPILDEILLFDAIDKSRKKFGSKQFIAQYRCIIQLIKYIVLPLRPRQFKKFTYVDCKIFESRFTTSDTVMNLPDLYDISKIYFKFFKKLMKIRLDGVDIAHWTYPLPVRAVNAKNIYTIHDLVPLKLPNTTLDDKQYHYRLIEEICRKADHIITVSEHSKNDICSTFDAPKNFVSNTYQVTDFSDSQTPENAVKHNSLIKRLYGFNFKEYFLAVGAIEPKKNYQRLFEAYMSADIQKPLVVIGPLGWSYERETDLLKHYEKNIKREGSHRNQQIIRLGYVPREHLKIIIKGAIAIVFPSLYEGFGLPVLEAMQLGTPVIASNAASIPEVGGNAPLYVDPYSSESIREALLRVCREPELCNEMSAKGLEKAKEFNFEWYSKRINEIYESVLKRRE
jgi:glycosyltransferase involved in cell wall biosynthesis